VIAGYDLGFPRAVELRLVDSIVHILVIFGVTASCEGPRIPELVGLGPMPRPGFGLVVDWGTNTGIRCLGILQCGSALRPSFPGLRLKWMADADLGAAEASSCYSISIQNYYFLRIIMIIACGPRPTAVRPTAPAHTRSGGIGRTGPESLLL
jgi:hypothetical protein